MEFRPKAILVLSVAALVAVGAVVRGLWIEPILRHRAANRVVARMEREGKLAEGLVVFQSRQRHPLPTTGDSTKERWDRCGEVIRTNAGWMVRDTSATASLVPLSHWIAQGRGNRFALERPLGVGLGASPCRFADFETVFQRP
jgi:hypothetical protein